VNNRQIFCGIAVYGGLITLATILGTFKAPFKIIAIGSLTAVPFAVAAQLVAENRCDKRVKLVESELNKLTQENRNLQQLSKQLDAVLAELDQTKSQLLECDKTSNEALSKLHNQNILLTGLKLDNQKLIDRVKDYEETYATSLDSEIQQGIQAYKDNHKAQLEAKYRHLLDEAQEITIQAMKLPHKYKDWGEKVADRLVSQKGYILGLTKDFNYAIDEASTGWEKERDTYLAHIEVLEEKVGRLQQRLSGDLVEPEYLNCGFDQNGKIANSIAEWLWNHHQTPLKAAGYEVNGDILNCCYAYSRSLSPESLIKLVEQESANIARNLGLYGVESPRKLNIADLVTIKVRRERPVRKADKGNLYRSRDEFVKYILSQPVRLRIVGEPGSGKSPSIAVLIGHILNRGFLSGNTPNGKKLPYCIVQLSNPLADVSVKNGDDLDFCFEWNDGKKAFRGLADEYKFRKNPVNSGYKNQVGYIWIADEFDNTLAGLTKDEAKPFKDCLKDGGHINIGVIVIGQSANVSTTKGLSIDDQKMLTNIYIDPVSIRTFLTQYGERFYGKSAVEKALNTIEQLELEIEEQNEIICDTAREFRIAMVTANRSPVFYQLPYLDSVEIDVTKYQEMTAIVSEIKHRQGARMRDEGIAADCCNPELEMVTAYRAPSRESPYAGNSISRDTSKKPPCPHCGSNLIQSKGSKWLCKNPEHSVVAPGKPKEWKKEID
jgi:hypothetical protein